VVIAATSSSGGNIQLKRSIPSLRFAASRVGNAAARTTPSRPKPSLAAVNRVLRPEFKPISAPQA
jgi:hypothetical protein